MNAMIEFAKILEKAGFENALDLIEKELIPLAQKLHVSLLDASWKYADLDEEQDTSWYQLWHALMEIDSRKLAVLDIHKPL